MTSNKDGDKRLMSRQNAVATTDEHIREVLKPILYTDIFDYPLTVEEVHRFLEFEASLEQVRGWLDLAVKDVGLRVHKNDNERRRPRDARAIGAHDEERAKQDN